MKHTLASDAQINIVMLLHCWKTLFSTILVLKQKNKYLPRDWDNFTSFQCKSTIGVWYQTFCELFISIYIWFLLYFWKKWTRSSRSLKMFFLLHFAYVVVAQSGCCKLLLGKQAWDHSNQMTFHPWTRPSAFHEVTRPGRGEISNDMESYVTEILSRSNRWCRDEMLEVLWEMPHTNDSSYLLYVLQKPITCHKMSSAALKVP